MRTQVTPTGGVMHVGAEHRPALQLTGLFVDAEIDVAGEAMYRKLLLEVEQNPGTILIVLDKLNNWQDLVAIMPALKYVQNFYMVNSDMVEGTVSRTRERIEAYGGKTKPRLTLWINSEDSVGRYNDNWHFMSNEVQKCAELCDAVYATMSMDRFASYARNLPIKKETAA